MANHESQSPPFKRGWWSFDLGHYRPCDSTYCLYPYDALPPIPLVNENLAWLPSLSDQLDQQMALYRAPAEARGQVERIAEQAATLGLALPESFSRLMSSPALQDRIPSCTACEFKLAARLVPCPGSDEGFLVGFLRDQQDVLLWYLYLSRQEEQCVLVSPYPLDEMDEMESQEQRQAVLDATYICAPSFAEFIYRFWLENTIWFKLSGEVKQQTLTEPEWRYLAHYQRWRTLH